MSREHELILELRAARRAVREAEIAEQEAAVRKAERKVARTKAQAAVEEILAEMDGTSDRPLIDAINRNGTAHVPAKGAAAAVRDAREFVAASKPPEEPESADERQRGPTAEDLKAGAKAKRRSDRKTREERVNLPADYGMKKQTERADRRETVIGPNGPIRQGDPKPLPPDPVQAMHDDHRRYQVEQEHGPGTPDPAAGAPAQWAASVPVPGVKGAQEFLGSFLATDEEDALAVARARWPGRPDIAVRRAGPPAAAGKPKARKAAKAGV